MFFFLKRGYLIFVTINILLYASSSISKENNVANFFSGKVSFNQNYNETSYKYLKKAQSLKKVHKNYDANFVRLLILLGRFDEAISFSKSIWSEEELLFEADLILGINYFNKNDFENAKKHFLRLNQISKYNLFFDKFFGNILMSLVEATQGNKADSFEYLNNTPNYYNNIKMIQNSFLLCTFDDSNTENSFKELVANDESGFSRYNFFLVNYYLHKNNSDLARITIKESRKKNPGNILIKQSEKFILKDQHNKIKKLFNCKNTKDIMGEFFYIMANLYSTDKNYQQSNFYYKVSLFLNSKFKPNEMLFAENLYNQKKYDKSKKAYKSVKSFGKVYSWHASKNISTIYLETDKNKNYVTKFKKEFDLITNPDFENYYDLANFYKENEYYEESIKYYSLALKNINEEHYLLPKILERRGTSHERLGDWKKAEKDLEESLKILPDQPYVLNYLAYTWIDKGMNLEKALEMVEKASTLKKNDGYIIDSLGWGHYMNKNYIAAEKFLQRAVELMPQDPIINDHYADALWMAKKSIQARYFWNYVLQLDKSKEKLKESISKKLIFGIGKNL